MNTVEAHTKIRDMFRFFWLERYPQYPIQWDNEQVREVPEQTPFVALTVLPNPETVQASFGGIPNNRQWRSGGVVIVQIFVPVDTGIGVAEELFEAVRECFQGKTVEDLIFRGTAFTQAGRTSTYAQFNASTGFQYDHFM